MPPWKVAATVWVRSQCILDREAKSIFATASQFIDGRAQGIYGVGEIISGGRMAPVGNGWEKLLDAR